MFDLVFFGTSFVELLFFDPLFSAFISWLC